jgi:hypothetical protein
MAGRSALELARLALAAALSRSVPQLGTGGAFSITVQSSLTLSFWFLDSELLVSETKSSESKMIEL